MPYQNVIIDGVEKTGNAKSHISWENICNTGVSFYQKTVCDIGCFHGYFSFQAEEAGAKEVIGYEPEPVARARATEIGGLRGSNVKFVGRRFGESKFFDRRFDVVLALNMLHWVRKQVGIEKYKIALRELFESCDVAVFEVTPVDSVITREIALECGKIPARIIKGHRHGRDVIYFVPWADTKKINIKDVKDYVGCDITVSPIDFERAIDALLPHLEKGDFDAVKDCFFREEAVNQPIHDIAMKYYKTPAKNTLRLIDCINGLKAGVMLPPIGLKENNMLHQGHTRVRAYKLLGLCDIELDYYDKDTYMEKATGKRLGINFLL